MFVFFSLSLSLLVSLCHLQESKRSSKAYFGRNEANTKVIIPADVEIYKDFDNYARSHDATLASATATAATAATPKWPIKPGDFVVVDITESNSQVLKGTPLYHSTISDFSHRHCHNSE